VDLSAASHQDQSCIVDVVVPIDEWSKGWEFFLIATMIDLHTMGPQSFVQWATARPCAIKVSES
jgi:hypothetical protein